MSYHFEDKKILITGSSRGIGAATAKLFAQAGAHICIHYNSNKTAAQETLEALEGSHHTIIQADLSIPINARQLVIDAQQQLGGLDILVNNAGVFIPHPLDATPFEKWFSIWQQTINTNLTAAAVASYTAAEFMRQQHKGKIINVGSRGAFRGEALQVAYGASKAGLHALGQSLAIALANDGITVHTVAPGFVETAMARPHLQGEAGEAVKRQSPLNRVARVTDIAQAIAYLADNKAEYTTGCILDINGASYLRT